jgi:serine/threonine-protein kinase HipA
MARSRLAVLDGPTRVGSLVRDSGKISFVYATEWLADPTATPLSVAMPLAPTAYQHPLVENWLWGALPDNDRVLARWARTFHTSAKQPFGLLTAVGRDLPGRFQIAPEDAVDPPSGVEWLSDDDVAQLLREVRNDHTAWLGAAAQGRWSLAGAQAKIALRRDGRRFGRPYGLAATTHILKPAITGLDDHDLNEHLCLAAARHAGLLAVRTEVVSAGDERAICVERYDRVLDGDDVLRVHQEDVCQALGMHPESKYESDGGPSVATVAALLERAVEPAASSQARNRFADALVLNWLIAGPDAHAKNYSLLLSGSQVRLAPLYDVASALPYADFHGPKLRLAMRIGRTYQAARMTADRWRLAATQLGIDETDLLDRIHELARSLPEAFAKAADDRAVRALASPLPQRLVTAVGDRCTSVVRLLA